MRRRVIRSKRKNRALWTWSEKLYIPCTLATKGRYLRLAREMGMSQAELGLVVVEAAIFDPAWLHRAIKRYRKLLVTVPDLAPPKIATENSE